jgi:transposase
VFIFEQLAFYPKEALVYVDESGIDSYFHRAFGWAKRGEKVWGEVSGRRFARESFIAAKRGKKILAPFCFQGTCHTMLFNEWVETFLVPVLKPGQVVILDNATFHKSERTKRLIEEAGCSLLFLPPYSPDLNPIEKFWARFKTQIKNQIHTFKTLSQAIDYAFLNINYPS